MLKVVHIHTDLKFLEETERFNRLWFENTVIVIGEKNSNNGNQAIFVSQNNADLAKVVKICSGADVVVLYCLDYVKSYLALKIPRNITVVWRFFGTELYGRRMVDYLSASSMGFHDAAIKDIDTIVKCRRIIGRLIFKVKHGTDREDFFLNAVRRVDLFLGLSKYEYDHLTQTWHSLPPFVQIPYRFKNSECHSAIKDNVVIVGNSRNIYNNHIDVIDAIETTQHNNQLSFLIPFSYGEENHYTSEIRRRVRATRENIVLLENFMPRGPYYELVTKAKAGVSNSYRQHAMGNVYQFINAGMKVYLSSHNVIYQWFKDLGLKVFTMEDFASDLQYDDLELTSEDKEWNCSVLTQLFSKFNEEQFSHEINNFVRNKKLC